MCVFLFFCGGTSYGLFYKQQKEVNIIKRVCVCALLFAGENLFWFVLHETKRGIHY